MTRTTRSRRIAASSSSEDEAVVPAATAKVRAAAAAAPTPRKRAKKASTTTTASTTLRQTTLTQLPRPRLAARSSGWQAPAVSSIIDVEVSSNAGDADFVPCAGHWTSGAIDSRLWMDKYAPVTEDECAVHKNKVRDVREWLKVALDDRLPAWRKQRMLIMDGPSGSGKTAVLRMLAMELDYEIVEWVNGMNENALEADDDQGARDDDDRRRYVPAMERFALFLKQADKYPALEFGDVVNNTCLSSGASAAASRKVIVVEDLPYLSTSAMRLEFQRLLRQHLDSARTSYPLVLVMSDFSDDHSVDANDARFLQQSFDTGRRAGSATGGDAMHLYSILPPDILRHHYCKKITFNPVAKTFLTKMLSAIVQEEYSRAPRRPSATMIQLIAEGSDGDIRTAINTLQFVTLQCDNSCAGLWEVTTGGGPVKKRRGKMGETVAVASDLPFLSCKDTRFDLFHALGKVLYAKRRPDASPGQSVSLPAHLRHFERPHALQTPIDEVVQGLPIAESLYLLYLHANYTTFHADIDDALLLSADGFSLADTLPRQYYGKFVAASSVAMSVDCAPSASGSTRIFQSMCKPKFFDCLRKRKELAGTGDGLFESWRQTYCSGARGGLTTVFDARMSVSPFHAQPFVDVFAYLAMIIERQKTGMASDDRSFLQSVRRFSSRQVQASEGIAEVVREKDVVVHGGPDDSEDENNADIGRPPTKRREAASLPPPAHLTYLPDDDIVDMSDDEFG